MNFKNWIESAILMTPYQAVKELGLTDKIGQILDEDMLSSTYRKIAIETHPDKNSDPSSALRFKKATEAYEVLRSFIGKNVPDEYEPQPHDYSRNDFDSRSDFYKEISRKLAPINQYTMEEFNDWINSIVEKEYFQVKNRHSVQHVSFGMKLIKNEPSNPLGSVKKTFRITGYAKKSTGMQKTPVQSIRDLFKPYLDRIPKFIVDMKLKDQPNWKEAWITMELPNGSYQSVSFFPIVKKTKDPNIGMKKDEVIDYLKSNGLILSGSYKAGDNYGLSMSPAGYFVQIGPKVVRVIKRYRGDYYGKKTIETINLASEHYGKITKELLEKYINLVKKRSESE